MSIRGVMLVAVIASAFAAGACFIEGVNESGYYVPAAAFLLASVLWAALGVADG